MGRVMARVNKFRQRHLNQRMAAAIELGMGVFRSPISGRGSTTYPNRSPGRASY
jgi:hypothetical protein